MEFSTISHQKISGDKILALRKARGTIYSFENVYFLNVDLQSDFAYCQYDQNNRLRSLTIKNSTISGGTLPANGLDSTTFENTWFIGINISDTSFDQCSFSNVHFSKCIIDGAVFERCRFSSVTFSCSKITNTQILSPTTFTDVSFPLSDISNTKIPDSINPSQSLEHLSDTIRLARRFCFINFLSLTLYVYSCISSPKDGNIVLPLFSGAIPVESFLYFAPLFVNALNAYSLLYFSMIIEETSTAPIIYQDCSTIDHNLPTWQFIAILHLFIEKLRNKKSSFEMLIGIFSCIALWIVFPLILWSSIGPIEIEFKSTLSIEPSVFRIHLFSPFIAATLSLFSFLHCLFKLQLSEGFRTKKRITKQEKLSVEVLPE